MAASRCGRFLITDQNKAADLTRASVEHSVRDAYGRMIALLASRSRNLAAAEDALSEALARALLRWPEFGIPEKPEAWLLTTARHYLIDQARKVKTSIGHEPHLIRMIEEAEANLQSNTEFPDERLKLLFVCAHPDIDPTLQTPLMLQSVLGLSAGRIASAYLVRPSTMSQRLVRLKQTISQSEISFEVPDRDEWPARLSAVLQAIYGAYTAGWDDHADASLANEAVYLASLITTLIPYEAEAAGLLSLILHCEARRGARRDEAGRFVPLDQQDTTRWDAEKIAEAERLLGTALRMDNVGRFQLEAALQSAHAARKSTGETDWPAILAIYEKLLAIHPSLGALVGRAAAIGQGVSAKEGLKTLNDLPQARVQNYQPYWATRAHLEALNGDAKSARLSYQSAIGLTSDRTVRSFLIARLANLDIE